MRSKAAWCELGFVTLYCAYAEAQLDDMLQYLAQVNSGRPVRVHSFGSKVGEAARLVAEIGANIPCNQS